MSTTLHGVTCSTNKQPFYRAPPMVRVTLWLQLLLVVLILRQSAAVSDHCSELQEEIVRVRKLNHRNTILVDQCYEQLKSETHISEAAFRSLKLAEDEFKSKRQQSEEVINDLKKQLEVKEEILKSNNETQTQLQATIVGLTKTVQSLNQTIQRLCETPEHVCRYLLDAVKSGVVDTAKILFKCSNDSCTNDDMYRDTPLTYAATYGHVAVVRVLLEGGANLDSVNAYRNTALHRAASYGHLDVCRLLLDWGAKVDSLNRGKDTPLHWAAREGHLSVVKLLVERGADVSVKNEKGQTACDLALISGKKDVADWLDSVKRGKGPLTV